MAERRILNIYEGVATSDGGAGEVQHEDSLGNKGVVRSRDVQWMTAGSGIIHQEMPHVTDALMMVFSYR